MSMFLMAKGFTLGISMILPIGSQNAMVLNQGINKHYHLTTATLFAIFDIILIGIGVLGGSLLIGSNETIFTLLTWGGILFLCSYGIMSLRSAVRVNFVSQAKEPTKRSLKIVVLSCLVVTFLNPHAYIDTIMIIGSVSGQYEGQAKLFFTIGVMSASIVWFYALASGASKLSNFLSKPKVKQGIDVVVAIIMFYIAASLFTAWFNA